MNSNTILAAINDAKQERQGVVLRLAEMERQQQRLFQLDTFIAQGELLLGLDKQKNDSTEHPVRMIHITKDSIAGPNWIKARTIYRENGNKPLKLTDLVREFKNRGWKLSDKNSKEVMRSALKNKPDIFAYDSHTFTYRLKESEL